jgi:hypothetical protein
MRVGSKNGFENRVKRNFLKSFWDTNLETRNFLDMKPEIF